MHRLWRLADALALLLLFLLPLMILLGSAERTAGRPTLLFWFLLILPLLILPWLWRRAEPEECSRGQVVAARRVERDAGVGEDLAALVAPVIDVRRSYSEAGVAIVEGRLRDEPARAFESLERLLAPRRTPLLEDLGPGGVRVAALPQALDAELRRGRRSPITNVALFLATVVTTVWAGALHRA